MALLSTDSENVQYNVIINADQALSDLSRLSSEITDFDTRVEKLADYMINLSKTSGVSVEEIRSEIQLLDKDFVDLTAQSLLFGQSSITGWSEINQQIQAYIALQEMAKSSTSQGGTANAEQALSDLSRLSSEITDFDTRVEKEELDANTIGASWETVGDQVQVAGQITKESTDIMAGGIDTVRIAIGALISMLVFNLIQAIAATFTNAIQYSNDYYNSLLNVSAAQDALARSGINVTNQDLLNTSKELEKTWSVFAEKDVTNAVSQIGLAAAQYGLSVEKQKQIFDMAAALSIQQGNAANLGTNVEQIVRSIEAGAVPAALKEWAVGFDANAVKVEAVRLHLVKEGETLSDNAKAIAAEALLWDDVNERVKKLQDEQNGVQGGAETMSSTWKNFLTELGKLTAPLRDELQMTFIDTTNGAIEGVKVLEKNYSDLVGIVGGDFAVIDAITVKHIHDAKQLMQIWKEARDAAISYTQTVMQTGGVDLSNTPTNPNPAPLPMIVPKATTPVTPSQYDSVMKDFQNYNDTVTKDTESFNQQISDLTDQYNLNRQKTVESYDLSVSNEKENYRLKEIQAEENYQNKIKQLNASFNLSLEDDLRKRDASAVLKLMESHQNQLDAAASDEKLREQQSKQSENLRLKQMADAEKLRLQQLDEEYQATKQKDTEHYQQQLQDAKTALDEKLQEEAVSIGQEKNLNANGITALYDLFKEYYGSNGIFAKVQNESYVQMVGQSNEFVAQMQTIMNQYMDIMGHSSGGMSVGGGVSDAGLGGGTGRRYAQGGVALASSATNAVFGEAGPELAMFLPLNGSPANLSMSGFGGGAPSAGGQVQIMLTLDPDLQAKITNNTLNQAAQVIMNTYRSR